MKRSGMSAPHFESALRAAERRAVVLVLRSHPDWTLGQVFSQLDGPKSEAVEAVTLGELIGVPVDDDRRELAPDGGPPIDRRRLERARRIRGEAFDEHLLAVLREAPGPVAASYLRARVGGPRWKVQAATRRLELAGKIRRTGRTSATRYRVVDAGLCEHRGCPR